MDKRTCRYCNNEYPSYFFEIANIINGKQYRRRKCKYCYTGTKKERRHRIRRQIIELKKTLKCIVCGNNDYRVLDFHHSRGQKKFSIGDTANMGPSFDDVLKEIEKCDVLCANCHRILHFKERYGVVV